MTNGPKGVQVPPRQGRVGVLHQPYFLPWLGYFSKLAHSDVFVVLDAVHFTKRHYLDRTKIVNMNGEIAWLSLPTGQNLALPIHEVHLRPPSPKTLSNLMTTLQVSYSKARFFEREWPTIEQLLRRALLHRYLLQVNMSLIEGLLAHLRIRAPETVLASDLGVGSQQDPTDRVLAACKAAKISKLLVGEGASQEVHDFGRLNAAGVRVQTQAYLRAHPTYSQSRRRRRPFEAGLSVVDALFNCGVEETRTFLTGHPATQVLGAGTETSNSEGDEK